MQPAWGRYHRCRYESYDLPTVDLRLKVRMLTAEAAETALYGGMAWASLETHCKHLCRAMHTLPCRSIGWGRQKAHQSRCVLPTHATIVRVEWGETVEATARKGSRVFVGFAVRMEPGRLPTYLMFGELPKDKGKRKVG